MEAKITYQFAGILNNKQKNIICLQEPTYYMNLAQIKLYYALKPAPLSKLIIYIHKHVDKLTTMDSIILIYIYIREPPLYSLSDSVIKYILISGIIKLKIDTYKTSLLYHLIMIISNLPPHAIYPKKKYSLSVLIMEKYILSI